MISCVFLFFFFFLRTGLVIKTAAKIQGNNLMGDIIW